MIKPVQFVKEVRGELTKVVWPSREQTIKMTLYVIAISLFVTIILGAVDFGLNQVIERFILE